MTDYQSGGFGGKVDWEDAEVENNPLGSSAGYAGWDTDGTPKVYTLTPPEDAAPIGCVMAWLKSYTNTPALSVNWVECNGQTLSDAQSVYDGQVIPNLNGQNRFLRGSSTSGSTGGSETHTHQINSAGLESRGDNAGTRFYAQGTNSGSGSSLPTYYEVVWIMRIK